MRAADGDVKRRGGDAGAMPEQPTLTHNCRHTCIRRRARSWPEVVPRTTVHMSPVDDLLEFVRLPSYERSSKGLFGEREHRFVESMLLKDPHAGAVVEGTGGVRKLRVALPGGGKRGGARVIYYFRQRRGRIYLVLVYAKHDRENITRAERNAMRSLIAALEDER